MIKLDELPGPKPESELARIILENHPEKIIIVLVHGKKGVGKSMFSIKVMWEIFEALGYEEDEAYKQSFENMIFRPDKLLNRLDKIGDKIENETGNPFKHVEPALCIDDAGVGLGGGLYRFDQETYWRLRASWDMLRTHVTGMFLTTPYPKEITKTFKGWNFRVKIVPCPEMGEKHGAEAWIYPEETDALGIHSYASGDDAWNNKFTAYMPNEYYYPYHQRRVEFRKEYSRYIQETKNKRDEIRKERD